MGRSQETFGKKEVRNKKAKKKREKEAKRMEKRGQDKKSLDDMIMYVDANGNFTDTPPDPSLKEEIEIESIEISVSKKEDIEEEIERSGTVTFFNDDKGFGFIKDTITGESVFVHINNTLEPIKENNLVKFEVEMGNQGPVAVKVEVKR
ncbi:MAG: cold shock domain-containing protein [Bacteroidetes bacterium]|jgi:cold shock CspA family protein|nr:cold shock domain-containing protein [Bacteroidota bacterium]